ncbi:hypothetical protein [Sorangium sp. So ce887]|uniref:hypothetical protein n=1 Tax=Sorangium sp. So ce887 TaxID=3133324 RepID=UPI003F61D621
MQRWILIGVIVGLHLVAFGIGLFLRRYRLRRPPLPSAASARHAPPPPAARRVSAARASAPRRPPR